ncbi:MAG TPA: hypothetical protein PKZ97_19630, partial [Azospirillaceae bacterium]|nr:hypothetical protein [Azospirillaceae bacterium]
MSGADVSSAGRRVLLTNATSYAGPGALAVLLKQGASVACHDPAFADQAVRRAFEAAQPASR